MIFRSSTRAKRGSGKSMRWESWWRKVLNWGRTACGPRLPQIGIHLSQATCGRLLALNRPLYGVGKPTGGAPHQRKEMPFRASYRHEWWSVDVRYIEEHRLGFPEPIYMISILENYSRAILASKISRTPASVGLSRGALCCSVHRGCAQGSCQ